MSVCCCWEARANPKLHHNVAGWSSSSTGLQQHRAAPLAAPGSSQHPVPSGVRLVDISASNSKNSSGFPEQQVEEDPNCPQYVFLLPRIYSLKPFCLLLQCAHCEHLGPGQRSSVSSGSQRSVFGASRSIFSAAGLHKGGEPYYLCA